MTKGKIGLNAGAIWNLLADGESFTFETLKKGYSVNVPKK